ncbi:MAG: CBS domain-containing protein [Gemmatimonadaceae bacterium]
MLKVRELMTHDVLTVAPNVSVREAAELLSSEGVGGTPVVLRGNIVGMVSARDLLDFIASLPSDPAEVDGGTEHGILDDHTVEEAMTRGPLCTIAPDDAATKAATLMKEEGVHRLPVVEGTKLVGIISTLDLVRALADGKLSRRTFVFPSRGSLV